MVDEGGEGGGSYVSTIFASSSVKLRITRYVTRYHLMMLFGGGEFLMEAMDISAIRDDVPEFDAAWLDFCRLFNASNAE